jgi:uncharacterized protein with ParB-like and HNH nuclease domain
MNAFQRWGRFMIATIRQLDTINIDNRNVKKGRYMQIGILPPELKSIEQLFTGDFRYAVPKYQRSFAWGPDEIGELWEDLVASINRQGEYFLGTIVLHRK